MVYKMFPTPDEMLKSAWNSLDASINALNNGDNVDISLFDSKARAFCEMLAKLPSSEAKLYENSLKKLIDHLAEVTHRLEVRKDELGDRITAINQRQHAYNAYGSAMFLALQLAGSED
jgi:hypothetical protein